MEKIISIYLAPMVLSPKTIIEGLKSLKIRIYSVIDGIFLNDGFYLNTEFENYLVLITPEDLTQILIPEYIITKILEIFNSFIRSEEFKDLKFVANEEIANKLMKITSIYFPSSSCSSINQDDETEVFYINLSKDSIIIFNVYYYSTSHLHIMFFQSNCCKFGLFLQKKQYKQYDSIQIILDKSVIKDEYLDSIVKLSEEYSDSMSTEYFLGIE